MFLWRRERKNIIFTETEPASCTAAISCAFAEIRSASAVKHRYSHSRTRTLAQEHVSFK